MLASSLPLFRSCAVVWGLRGVMWLFTTWLLRSTHSHVHLCRSAVLSDFAPCPPSLSGKYEVSIMVPLFFAVWRCLVVAAHRVVMVALQLGSCAQGCHGCPTRSAIVLPYLSGHLLQAHLLLMSLIDLTETLITYSSILFSNATSVWLTEVLKLFLNASEQRIVSSLEMVLHFVSQITCTCIYFFFK